MPTYDYKCENCESAFEFFQSMKDDPITLCPQCGHNDLKKMVSLPAGLIFKGSGFYLTDYKKKNSSPAVINNSEGTKSVDSNDVKADTPKETKSDTKEKKSASKKKKDK